ncbi:uncharacterized protein NPIL_214541 [Nephila pilipes]|uniref:Uncharacterized protein n=1 Tax=Nephila pilipes TaxID=299642 RepID=A0A8X6Q685_NEPPI|nr:uncharacterized protein NPIL_214541 [Nephila pilipes]
MEADALLQRLIFSYEVTFHLNGKVKRQNIRIGVYKIATRERLGEAKRVLCLTTDKILWSIFNVENTESRITYLTCWKNGSFLNTPNIPNIIFQQEGTPQHWNCDIRGFFCNSLPQQWVGCMGNQDLALLF